MSKHVHHEVIVAYLEGKTVQMLLMLKPESWKDYRLVPDAPLPMFSPEEQWRIKPVEVRRWYVHDRFDTLADYATIDQAAKMALHAIQDGSVGIHMIWATPEENAEYCNTGVFPFANK